MVQQGPRLGFAAETGRFVAMKTPFVRFSCLPAPVPCFLLFFSLFFLFFLFFLFLFFSCIPVCLSPSCPFVCAAAICYSQQVRIYSTCSFCLCHLYPTPSRNSFVFYSFSFFFIVLVSRVAFFFCCALVPGTLALDLPTLILQQRLFFSVSLSDHRICISLG